MVPELVEVKPLLVTSITAVPTAFAVNTALILSTAAARSLSSTPSVFKPNDQLSAATFATKLPEASREMA
ncbi:hypothetical protein ES703_84690 [subsurface metagenome]